MALAFKVRLMRQLEKRCGNAARRVPRKNPAECSDFVSLFIVIVNHGAFIDFHGYLWGF